MGQGKGSYYKILKVNLKKAHKRLAMTWHPDKSKKQESEAKFNVKQISDPEAYDVLATLVESKLECTLEELYKGCKMILTISRTVPDEFGKLKAVKEMMKIDIKPGWKKGTIITLHGKANQEAGTAAPSDLIIALDEKPHAIFKRKGNDLEATHKISLVEALTGSTLNLTTLDGRDLTIQVTSTDVVKPGYELVVPNEGMPIAMEPGKKGNLIIKFDVIFPSRLTSQQRDDVKRILSEAEYD